MGLRPTFNHFVSTFQLFNQNHTLLLALSGGVDSMVLLDLLLHLPVKLKPNLVLGHFNHHLRQVSDQEESYLVDYAQRLNLPLEVGHWSQNTQGAANIESRARQARYEFFDQIIEQSSEKITHLATGHHGDDQVETILMKLIRGGLIEDKVGINRARHQGSYQIVRPLLFADKTQIYKYAQAHQIPYIEDESNQENIYLRNRIRHHIIPNLKKENEKTIDHVQEFADELSDLVQVSQQLVQERWADLVKENQEFWTVDLGRFKNYSSSFQRIFLKEMLKRFYKTTREFNKEHISQIYNLVHSQTPNQSLNLSHHVNLKKTYNTLTLTNKSTSIRPIKNKDFEISKQDVNCWFDLSVNEQFGIFEAESIEIEEYDQFIYTNRSDLNFPLVLRHRRDGDRMSIKGLNGRTKIKSVFINQKIPLEDRESAWLVEDQKQIIWLIGYKESQLSQPKSIDKMSYILVYRTR